MEGERPVADATSPGTAPCAAQPFRHAVERYEVAEYHLHHCTPQVGWHPGFGPIAEIY